MNDTFDLTENHIKLLSSMSIGWDDGAYDGAPAVDCKRPYGNSSVWQDVAEIIGIEEFEDDDGESHWPKGTREKCMELHRQTGTAMQIILQCQTFEPGTFKRQPYGKWVRHD